MYAKMAKIDVIYRPYCVIRAQKVGRTTPKNAYGVNQEKTNLHFSCRGIW